MAKRRKIKLKKFDAAEYLDSPGMAAAYLSEALETKDTAFIFEAVSTVMRSKSMSKIAKKARVLRLYKSFDGSAESSFVTIQKFLDALGFELAVKSKASVV